LLILTLFFVRNLTWAGNLAQSTLEMNGSQLQDLNASQQLRLLSDDHPQQTPGIRENSPHLSTVSDNSIDHKISNEAFDSTPAAQDSSYDNAETKNLVTTEQPDNHSATTEHTIQTQRSKTLEILCSLFSFGVLGAMIGTIYPYQRKPRPQWPSSISINALLSIYATVFKTALISVVGSCISQNQWICSAVERPLYDLVRYNKAGQESLEALRWLWWNKLRQPVASLGAFIFVVAVAIDPFVQQLVQYVDCSVNLTRDPELAGIPRTSFFNPTMFHQGAGNNDAPSSEEESAVLSGIFSPPTDVNFNCLTGNCTFPIEYGTVGYCSYCEDVSSNLKFSEDCNSQGGCNITSSLPSGLSLSSDISSSGKYGFLKMAGTDGIGIDAGPFEVIVGQTRYTQKSADPTTGDPILGCDDSATNSTWRCRGYGAASCSFSPCVRTYKASIEAGRLNESITDHSDPRLHWGFSNNTIVNSRGKSFLRGLIDTQCISSEEKSNLISLGYTIDAQSRWLPYNITSDSNFNVSKPVPLDAPFPQSLLAHKCLYIINHSFTVGFVKYFLNSLLSGTVSGQETGIMVVNFDGPQVPLHIYNFSHNDFGTIDSIFNNAATTFTAHIRENGEDIHSEPATGVASRYATCVQINWAWISLPAALAGLTLVLLALSIEATRRHQAPIWKSSPLAFIFHGPDGARWLENSGSHLPSQPIRDHSLNSVSAMENSAKRLTVVLDRSESTIRLRKVRYNQHLPKTWFERIFKR
jgi:hypothetical protein